MEGDAVTLNEKKKIVQAIYDRKCTTDGTLSMVVSCEPIRKVVQSLALNLMGMLEPQQAVVNNKNSKQTTKLFSQHEDETLKHEPRSTNKKTWHK